MASFFTPGRRLNINELRPVNHTPLEASYQDQNKPGISSSAAANVPRTVDDIVLKLEELTELAESTNEDWKNLAGGVRK